MNNIRKSLLRQDLKDLQTSSTYYHDNDLRELIGLFIAVMDGSHTIVEVGQSEKGYKNEKSRT